MCCHRAAEHQTGCPVIYRSTQNKGRSTPCLFMAALRVEIKPNDIAFIGNKAFTIHHQTSLPTGSSSGTSGKLSGEILATKSASTYLGNGVIGLIVHPSAVLLKLTFEFSDIPRSSRIATGKRIAKLLPHLPTVSSISSLYIISRISMIFDCISIPSYMEDNLSR